MKRIFQKALLLLLGVILLIEMITPAAIAAAEDSNYTNGTNNSAELTPIAAKDMLENQIRVLTEENGCSLTVSTVKDLTDFAGNRYYLVEFSPLGYIICDGTYGRRVEYSLSSRSPYWGCDGALYYGGPTFYFSLTDDTFVDQLYDETISLDDTAAIQDATITSVQFLDCLAENAEYHVISDSSEKEALQDFSGKEIAPAKASPTGTKYYVPNATGGNKIINLKTQDQIGYYSYDSGVCGYIATGLMLYWIDECTSYEPIINDFAFIRGDHNGFNGPNLTRELFSYGEGSGSSALGWPFGEDMCDIIDTYANNRSLTIGYEWRMAPFSGMNSVYTAITTNNKPVIVFGSLTKGYSNHAVLAYGYSSNNEIIVHYGHANFSEVVLSGIFGSSIELESYSSNAVPVADVPVSHWAYISSQYCTRYQIIPRESGNKYYPNRTMTRGEFINALYVLAGSPEPEDPTVLDQYLDINPSSPYYNAAIWTVEKNIMNGMSPTSLGLAGSLTREQAVTFFYRYSNFLECAYSVTNGPAAYSFPDYSQVSIYARIAMDWATRRYILTGDSGYLYPQRALTRAEAGQLVYKLQQKATRTP